MNTAFRKLFAFFVAFFVAALLMEALRFTGPFLAGWVIMALNIPPLRAQNVATLEASGNIFLAFIIFYVGIKVYKKLTKDL